MTIFATLVFLISNVAAVVIAAELSMRIVAKQFSPMLRIAAGIACYIVMVSLLTLVLGQIGWLDARVAMGALGVPAIGALLMLRRRFGDSPCVTVDPRQAGDWSPLLAIALGLGAWWLVRNLALGNYISLDDKTYHAAILAHWLSIGGLDIAPTTYQAYYPLNGELLCLWLMLPFGHDGAVPFNGLIYLALFICVSVHITHVFGVPKRWQLLPGILILASSGIFSHLTTFADVDFGAPVMLLTTIAFLLASLKQGDGCDRQVQHKALALLGGACAGFTVGMKVSFAPPVALVCAIYAVVVLSRRLPKQAMLACLGVAGCALVGGSYWYLRNWILTGNPIYPAAVGPFEGPFFASDQDPTKLTTVIAAGLQPEQWRALLNAFLNKPYPVAVFGVAGFLTGVYCCLRRNAFSNGQRLLAGTLVGCAVVVGLFFPITPFSGTNELGTLESTGRYLMFPFLACFVLVPLLFRRLPKLDTRIHRLIALGVGLVIFTAPFVMTLSFPAIAGVLIVTLTVFFGLELALASQWAPINVPGFRWAPILVPLLAAVCAPINLWSTDRIVARDPLAREIEKLPPNSAISQYNGWLFFSYELAGRRQQHQPVRLLGDGRRYTPMHTRPGERAAENDFWMYERQQGESGLNADTLVKNLKASGIDMLITSPHPDGTWPMQHDLLVSSGEFAKFSEGEFGVIWDLRNHGFPEGDSL